jgi:Ca2+/Na+ antiporter
LNEQVAELALESTNPRAWVSILLLLLGIILLACGAHATVTGAVDLARLLGLSDRVIGLTIVSAGTGLPEVVALLISIYLVYLLILLKSPSVSALIPNEHLLKFVDVGLDAVP